MAPALAAVAVVGTLAGAGIQAFGQYQGGKAQKAMYDYKAAVAQQNAQYESMAGQQRAQVSGLRTGQRIAQIRAAQGASNLDVNRGSGVDVVESQRQAGRYDQRVITAEAERRAYGQRTEAGLDVFAGEQAETAGKISAAGTVVSGVGRAASMGMQQSSLGAGGGSVAPRWFQLYDEG